MRWVAVIGSLVALACGSADGAGTESRARSAPPPPGRGLGGGAANESEPESESESESGTGAAAATEADVGSAPLPSGGVGGGRADGAATAAGWDEERTLVNAAFATGSAPSVVVHAPPGFDPSRPLRLVIFLHGWSGCARVLMGTGAIACREGERRRDGWGLGEVFDRAGSDALFVIPQLAFMERDGSPGRFVEEGRFRAFLEELLASLAPRLGAEASLSRVASITLLAHSAGFETALAILARGGLGDLVHHVVLFDALYRGVDAFGAWALADPRRRLVSIHTDQARTASQSRRLAVWAQQRMGAEAIADGDAAPLAEQLATRRVIILPARAPHGLVPTRHLPELLAPLGLGPRSGL